MPDMSFNIEQAQKLLDFNQKLDIGLLENVIKIMYGGDGVQQKMAQEILTRLKEHQDAWTRVDTILEFSTNQETKYYALQILENTIKHRWKALPRAQCDGIKQYIVGLIIKISSNPDMLEKEKVYLGKLNIILVQILKKEWPHNWPNFISEIVGASSTNESLCQNNMIILKLLSEEVFDFSSGQMTQTKVQHLKEHMCKEFMQIFQLCQTVLDTSQNAPLVLSTLDTLYRFLSWIPLGYIFETKMIATLIHRFLMVPLFRNITLKCLTEIVSLNDAQFDEQLLVLYVETMEKIKTLIPICGADLATAYSKGTDDEQNFIQNLSLFLAAFLKEHGSLLEKKIMLEEDTQSKSPPDETYYLASNGVDTIQIPMGNKLKDVLIQGYYYLLLISRVEEIEIFKICLECWNHLAHSLYQERPVSSYIFQAAMHEGLGNSLMDKPPRWKIYQKILSLFRVIIISRMARPEEVLVVENDQGEVVREFMKDTDAINLYKNMRETLVFLTHLDVADTEKIMLDKLEKQVSGLEWSWKNLNSLCWAIGSISGAMCEDDEKRFLVTVIKDLLYLCEQKRGKDNKAIVASDIMYVVGQYPRFLRAHWKFLKTVINKLFEFMHETHEGVQDMACDTFIKIANKCRKHFIQLQAGEDRLFVEEIFANTPNIICDLSPQQVHTFYEAVGMMVSAAGQLSPYMDAFSNGNSSSFIWGGNKGGALHSSTNLFGGRIDRGNEQKGTNMPGAGVGGVNFKETLIKSYMALPNQAWEDIIEEASKNNDVLRDSEIIKQISNILKTNIRASKSLGADYVSQLRLIYLDMLNVYQVLSANILAVYKTQGPEMVNRQPLVKDMRSVRRDILALITSWFAVTTDTSVLENFISPLLESILPSYCADPAEIKEPEVLSTVSKLLVVMGGPSGKYRFANSVRSGLVSPLTNILSTIRDAVFEPTLGMITANFTDWPDHRTNFYEFLQTIVNSLLMSNYDYNLLKTGTNDYLSPFSATPYMNGNANVTDSSIPNANNHVGPMDPTIMNEIVEKEFGGILCFDINQPGGGPKFKLFFDSIIWGIKHTMRNVAETSLDILINLLKKIELRYETRVGQSFYQAYFTSILEHLFSVVSDTSLTADLFAQSLVLEHCYQVVENGKLPQFDPSMTNVEYIRQYTYKLLKTAFPHLTDPQINLTIQGFFTHTDLAFREHLRDFLVQIREYSGTDDADLYLAEKEQALKKAQEEKLASLATIPGMIKPSEISEEMQQ